MGKTNLKIKKFVKSKKYIAMIILSFMLIIIGTIRTSYAATYTRDTLQNAIIATAMAYVNNQGYSDYEQKVMDHSSTYNTGEYHTTYAFRTFTQDPDSVSRNKKFFIDCSSFATSAYINSLGYDFSEYWKLFGSSKYYINEKKKVFESATEMKNSMQYYYRGPSTSFLQNIGENAISKTKTYTLNGVSGNKCSDMAGVFRVGKAKYNSCVDDKILVYYRKATDSVTKDTVESEIKGILEPGDLIIRRHFKEDNEDDESGHVVLYAGDKVTFNSSREPGNCGSGGTSNCRYIADCGSGGTSNCGVFEATGKDLPRTTSYGVASTSSSTETQTLHDIAHRIGEDPFSIKYSTDFSSLMNYSGSTSWSWDGTVFVVLRPLNKICDGNSCTSSSLVNTTTISKATTRIYLSKVRKEQYATGTGDKTLSKYGVINKEKNIVYHLRLQNRDKFYYCNKTIIHSGTYSGTSTSWRTQKTMPYTDKSSCTTGHTAHNWLNISPNNGTLSATSIGTITATVPSGSSYVSCTGGCTKSGDTVTWTFNGYTSKTDSSLSSNNLYEISFTVDPTNNGTINFGGFSLGNTSNNGKLSLGTIPVTVANTIRGWDEGKIRNGTTLNNTSSGTGLTYVQNIYSNAYGGNWSFLTESNILAAIFNKFGSKDDYDIVSTAPSDSNQKKIYDMMVPGMYGGILLRGNDLQNRIKYIDEKDFEVGDIIAYRDYNASSFNADIYMGSNIFRKSSSSAISNKYDPVTSSDSSSITEYYTRNLYNKKLFVVLRPSRIMSKVSYNLNGGTGTTPTSFFAFETYKNIDTSTKPTRSGYVFDGWSASSSGGTKLASTTALSYSADRKIYARWMTPISAPTNSLCKCTGASTCSSSYSSFAYTGSAQTLTTATSGTGYTLSGYSKTDAGSQTITASLSSGYIWSDGTTANKTFTCYMPKATPTITLSSSSGSVGVGGTTTFTATVKSPVSAAGTLGVSSGTTSVATVSPTSKSITATSAGASSGDIKITGVAAGSSTISVTFVPTSTTNFNNASIKTYTATVSLNKATIPTAASYCLNPTYNGSEQTIVKTAGTGYTWTSGSKRTNAGTSYPVVATLKTGYTWSDNTTGTKTITCGINKKELTTPSVPADKTYNGSSQASGITCPTGSTSGGTTAAMNAGTYTQTCKITTDNYTWPGTDGKTINIDWKINKKYISVYAPSVKTGLVYNGSSQVIVGSSIESCASPGVMYYYTKNYTTSPTNKPAFSSTSGDWVTTYPSNASATNAGSYYVYGYCYVSDTNNYEGVYINMAVYSKTAVIAKKELTITAKAQTIDYGNSINTSTSYITTNGLISGHSVNSITLTPSTSSITSNGTITPSSAVIKSGSDTVTSNYDITYNTGKLVITASTATIPTATNYCLNPTYNGSEQTIVKTAGTGYTWTSGTKATNAGTSYPVVATLKAGYAWSDGTTGTKTINCEIKKATTTVTQSATKGTSVVGVELTFNVNANTAGTYKLTSSNTGIATASQSISGTVSANTNNSIMISPTGVGSATITIAFTPTDSNYSSVTKTYAITVVNKATIPTTSKCLNPTYNGESQSIVSSAGTGYSWTSETSKTSASTYTVTASLNTGYRWSDNTTTDKQISCSIQRQAVTEPNCNNVTYDGETHTLLAAHTSGGYTNDAITGKDAGNYNTTLKLNSNYKWSSGSSVTSNRTKTCMIEKATPEVESVTISTAGIVSIDSTDATGYEVSLDGVNYKQVDDYFTYLSELTAQSGTRTVYVRPINTDTTNYDSTGEVITTQVEVDKITFNTDSNKGSLSLNSYNVIKGTKVSVSGNKLLIQGDIPNRRALTTIATITAIPEDGYSFSGFTGVVDTIDENTTITANWTLRNYNITYNLNGGTVSGNKTSYNIETATFTLNNPTKDGYTFKGWTGSNGDTPEKNVTVSIGTTGDLHYVANYESEKYTVNFNSNGGNSISSQEVNYGEKVLEPSTPTKEGYAFDGWYTNEELTNRYDFNTLVTQGFTLYAKWITGKYQITYDLNGGIANNPTYYDVETATFTLNEPTKEGYTFRGWTGSNGSTPQKIVTITQGTTGNKSYIANWNINTYIVTFNTHGGNNITSASVEYNKKVTRPADPEKTGYIFTNWYTDEYLVEEYNFNNPVTSNMTLHAGWVEETYTITFVTNGGTSITPIEAVYGESIEAPSDPEKTGHTFKGWYTDSELTEEFVFNTMPNRNITLYAKWEASKYQVIFNTNGGSAVPTQEVIYGGKATLPSEPSKRGYDFVGWYSDSNLVNEYDFNNAITKATVIYAKWSAINYSITYNLDGGEADNPESYTVENNAFTLNNPTKTGYKFLGWTGSNGTTPEKNITIEKGTIGNLNYVANYEIKTYTVNFITNGGSTVEDQEINYGAKVLEPTTPTKNGYAFEGWYKDDNLTQSYDFNDIVTSNITLYAKWITGKYQITYNLNGGIADNPTYYDVETETFTLNEPTKEGSTFKGWTGSNGTTPEKNVTITQGTTGNLSYTANWEEETYKIEFNYEGLEDIEGNYGDSITLPTPVKIGYTFIGWYTNSTFTEVFNYETMPAENVTLYPKFEINTYRIIFRSNGGSSISSMEIEYNSNIPTLSEPTKEGYEFKGWYIDEGLTEAFNLEKMLAENITLYAKWQGDTYTVSFRTNGGSVIDDVVVEHNDYLVKPVDPTRNGYVFGAWYKDSSFNTLYNFEEPVTSNLILYASWEIENYTITYSLDGGTATNKTSYNIETETFSLNNPTKEGYTFDGWTGSNGSAPQKTVTILKGTSGNKNYVANYTANNYTITFETNGGSSISSITKAYGEIVPIPTSPTKEGYIFAGWYSDSSLTRLYTFTTMPNENITLYAKWTNNSYVISYELNGGINDESNPTTYVGGDVKAINNPTREGYVFKGWYKESSFTNRVEQITSDMRGNITLYAKWEVMKYEIMFVMNGGEEKETITKAYGSSINISNPTREGYTFKGWYSDSLLTTPFTETTMPAHNLILYASWEANTYTITFDSNGGNDINSITAAYETPIEEPNKPLKEGYKFAGWYIDKEFTKPYSFDKMPSKDITLYAKWITNSRNTIKYVLNGGKNSVKNKTSYKYGETVKLYKPTRKGKEFLGWYLESDYQTRVLSIKPTMNGDITLYAKWKDIEGTKVPDTGSNISLIAVLSGITLISIGGYFIYSKKKELN